jgi:protein-tyrosine phosphatase/membrane-associated phospholipid phosphatase
MTVLFMVVYGWINSYTATRADVGVFRFGWENGVPFIPFFVLPYMSLDTFFLLSPFFCKNTEERRGLEKQVISGILISGLCFLLWPLHVTFHRPTNLTGPIGWLFNHFLALDPPFNACPSLHIVLSGVLLPRYLKRASRPVAALLWIWFALIAASTLLTYQHQFIDVIGGAALTGILFLLFPEKNSRFQLSHSHQIAANYLFGSLLFTAVALKIGGLAYILLWQSVAMLWVSAGYFGLGPLPYSKHDGRISLVSRILLAPALIGQWLSLRFYALQGPAFQRVLPNAWMGRLLSSKEAQTLVDQGVTAVLDLTCEFDETKVFLKKGILYKNIQILDLTAPTRAQTREAIRFLSDVFKSNGKVYVHCKAGYSRTAAVVGAWILFSNQELSADHVMGMLRKARPQMVIRPEAQDALRSIVEEPRTA